MSWLVLTWSVRSNDFRLRGHVLCDKAACSDNILTLMQQGEFYKLPRELCWRDMQGYRNGDDAKAGGPPLPQLAELSEVRLLLFCN